VFCGAWPREWGGAELTPPQRYLLEEELGAARFPQRDRIATDLVGPVILTFGSLAQKQRYLPRILEGKEFWCQGFSEPDAGSDVNSLRTTATVDGSDFIVEGSKLWTTNAHIADMMFGLVRLKTDRLDTGLTFLLINSKHPLGAAGVPGCARSANHACEGQASPINGTMETVFVSLAKDERSARRAGLQAARSIRVECQFHGSSAARSLIL
jgi:alkylation response protein AidB-like acyl-CoA dehydrogenase